MKEDVNSTNTNIQTSVTQNHNQIFVSKDYVKNIHSYAAPAIHMDDRKRKTYQCKNCRFVADKKNTLEIHETEFCVKELIKDLECPVCHKLFNYRRLRLHFNYFIAQFKKPETEQLHRRSRKILARVS